MDVHFVCTIHQTDKQTSTAWWQARQSSVRSTKVPILMVWWSSRVRQIAKPIYSFGCFASVLRAVIITRWSDALSFTLLQNKFLFFFLRRRINKISSLRLLRTNVARLDWATVCFGINKRVAEQTSIRFGDAHQRRASAPLLEMQTIVFDEANGRLLYAPQN